MITKLSGTVENMFDGPIIVTSLYDAKDRHLFQNQKKEPPKISGTFLAIISGAFVASTELLVLGHVCDRIKTHQQAFPKETSPLKVMRKIFLTEGVRGLYRGLEYNLVTYSGKGALRWATLSLLNDFFNKTIPENLRLEHPALRPILMAGSVSFIETFFLICPMESFKTQRMTGGLNIEDEKTRRKFSAQRINHWIKSGRYKSMYNGLDAVLVRQAVSWFSFLVAYEEIKRFTLKKTESNKLNIIQQIIISILAGGINVVCTTPIDTIKTQLQKNSPTYKKISFAMLVDFYKKEGLRGFYGSLSIRLFRSSFHATMTFMMMEKLGLLGGEYA